MAKSRQTARKSTGGKRAERRKVSKQLASKANNEGKETDEASPQKKPRRYTPRTRALREIRKIQNLDSQRFSPGDENLVPGWGIAYLKTINTSF